MQDRRDQRIRIEMQVGQDVGDGDRMGDVGLTRNALLAFMAQRAELIGIAYPLDLGGWQVGLELV